MIKRFFAFDERRKLMLASVKSFLIAFAVALLIFGLIGYFAMPQIKSLMILMQLLFAVVQKKHAHLTQKE